MSNATSGMFGKRLNSGPLVAKAAHAPYLSGGWVPTSRRREVLSFQHHRERLIIADIDQRGAIVLLEDAVHGSGKPGHRGDQRPGAMSASQASRANEAPGGAMSRDH